MGKEHHNLPCRDDSYSPQPRLVLKTSYQTFSHKQFDTSLLIFQSFSYQFIYSFLIGLSLFIHPLIHVFIYFSINLNLYGYLFLILGYIMFSIFCSLSSFISSCLRCCSPVLETWSQGPFTLENARKLSQAHTDHLWYPLVLPW